MKESTHLARESGAQQQQTPFFHKTGEGSFFSQRNVAMKPFFGTFIQPKLTIGPSNDSYEREANQVAKQIVSNLTGTADPSTVVQTQSDLDGELGPKPTISAIQRKPEKGAGMPVPASTSAAIQREQGKGKGLDGKTRTAMEGAFGVDFSGVRIHTGSSADRLNRTIQARAFTTGRDVFFRKGEYQQANTEGQELLAHELTHVVQQRGAGDTIQRLETKWGKWDANPYELKEPDWREGKGYYKGFVGLNMKLAFQPGELVDATHIGLVQSVRSMKNGEQITKPGTIPDGDHAGNRIDRSNAAMENNPLFGAQIMHEEETMKDSWPVSADMTEAMKLAKPEREYWEAEKAERGERTLPKKPQMELGKRHEVDTNVKSKPAFLHDRPHISFDKTKTKQDWANSYQLFETTALAIEGTQKGQYYGSVRWGWQTDAEGTTSKIELAQVGEDNPSATFVESAKVWNELELEADFGMVDKKERQKLPIPE